MMYELTKEKRDLIVKFLAQELNAYTVILFGSAAKGKLRQDSDIDIAIFTNQSHDPYKLFMTAQELADKLKRDVDLVDFKQASTVFQAQIVGNGILLFDGEPVERQFVFMRTLKEYAQLNEARQEILANKMNSTLGGTEEFGK